MPPVNPTKGEIWKVNFDRSRGEEIRNPHAALVMNVEKAGRLKLRMVVPITTGNPRFKNLFWMVEIAADSGNGLNHNSFADTFQFKSVSTDRFINKLGGITSQALLHDIASAIMLCVGYTLPGRTVNP